MHSIDHSQIIVNERQRKSFNEKRLEELADSIRDLGLLHPPVLRQTDEGLVLVAGERRLRAIKLLHDTGEGFDCNGKSVPPGQVPFLFLSELSDTEAFRAELEENLRRVNLSWQEEVEATARLHELTREKNPSAGYIDTAREIAEISERPLYSARVEVANAVALAPHLKDPEVRKAENSSAAMRIVQRKLRQEFNENLLIEPTRGNVRYELVNADSGEWLKNYDGRKFQMVLADPPYGISAHKHNYNALEASYDDTDEIGMDFAESVIPLLPSVIDTTGAWVFWFCDFRFFTETREIFRRCGFIPWEHPVIWFKKNSMGVAPKHYYGFRRTYEMLVVARWGDRELLSIQNDVIDIPQQETVYHRHEKPVDLYKKLFRLVLGIGERVLDPCCGSGTSFEAAEDLQLEVVGIEKSPEIYRIAKSRLEEIG